jgi:hypothetical protein
MKLLTEICIREGSVNMSPAVWIAIGAAIICSFVAITAQKSTNQK